MFILLSLIIVVFAKRAWLRNTAWCIWGLGLLYSIAKGTFFLYIPGTAMILGVLYVIRWIIRKARS